MARAPERDALVELLYQLADDDFLIAFRASEWLGLAPQIEEDVAFASIAQDEMGHAARYYALLEELGEGNANALAHGRTAAQRVNSVLVELANGEGSYLRDARFDWGFCLARHYMYDLFESIRLAHLVDSAHPPLADLARKVQGEERYHLLHHRTWLARLADAGGEARQRLETGWRRALEAAADLPAPGRMGDVAAAVGWFPDRAGAADRWRQELAEAARAVGLPGEVPPPLRDGRLGQHTPDLDRAIGVLSEVYASEPGAAW
jgi:ring-1,2-phenylacetyl-CoA epoxidase subunit PaaC